MLISCSTCGMRISKHFLVLGMPWSTHTCPGCGAVFAGTILRLLLVSVATGFLGYLLIGVIKGKANPILLAPAAVLAVVVLFCNLPGQIKRVSAAPSSEAPDSSDLAQGVVPESADEPAPESPVEATTEDTSS